MYYNLSETTSESAARCLELIARYAPKMMKLGGSLQGTNQQHVALSTRERERIESLRRSGMGIAEIARTLGRPCSTVSKLCGKLGLAGKRPSRTLRPEFSRAMELKAQGVHAAEAARRLGLAASTVHEWYRTREMWGGVKAAA